MSYSNIKSEISYRSSSNQRSSQRLRSSSSNVNQYYSQQQQRQSSDEGLSAISHVNGTSNPQRVIELNVTMKENPAKHRLKQEYMDKYRNMLGLSTLQIKEKQPKDLKVRIQDVENIIESTAKIENAHKRLNQKVEEIILANQPFCPAKIVYIQDTDEKVFYQQHRIPRAKENNVIMNNPVFNTLYDDVMQNKAVAQQTMRNINEANPSNPFRERYIQIIQNSEQCPQKYKEKLLEPLQRYIKPQSQQDETSLQVSRDEQVSFGNSTLNPQVELPSVVYKYHNEENFNKLRSRKAYQSGKPYFGTTYSGTNGFYKTRGSSQGGSQLNQTFDETLNRTHSNYDSSTRNRNSISRENNNNQQQNQNLFKVQHANKLNNSIIRKPNFEGNFSTYNNIHEQNRDMKLYFYETYSQQNSPFKIKDPTNPIDTILSKDPKNSKEYKKQANINYFEKRKNQYQTYKQRIPKLSVNCYAVQNHNTDHIYLHPKDQDNQDDN